VQLTRSRAFVEAYLQLGRGEFQSQHVEQALEQAVASSHCTRDEAYRIEEIRQKGGKDGLEDALIATRNVIQVHGFLAKYDSDLRNRGWAPGRGSGSLVRAAKAKPTPRRPKELAPPERDAQDAYFRKLSTPTRR
jgi:hypothetical protein